MFEDLIRKFDGVIRKLRGVGKLTEKNIEESVREIRRVLLEADVNYKVVKEFISAVQAKALGQEVIGSLMPGQVLVKIVHDEMVTLLGKTHVPLRIEDKIPGIVMLVGLQGSGKTTFAAKLGTYLTKQKRRVLLVPADVYRPAASTQLEILGQSAHIPVYSTKTQNPVQIAKEAVEEARKKGFDTVILDTAGRLHIDESMMNELKEMKFAVHPHEILFVADSMMGQDAVRSAQAFQEMLDFDGIVLTKMDSDTRGGAALSIRAVTQKPIKFITKSEKLDGIEPFYPDRMASRILGMGDVVTLVEKVQEAVEQEKREKLAQKLKKQGFTLEDFLDQLEQIRKMGPVSQLVEMLPGMGKMAGEIQVDERVFIRIRAMIQSMTLEERANPHIIDGSRRRRIAQGSGTTVQEVNQLLRNFQTMQTLMKRIGKWGSKRRMPGIPIGF